MKNLARRRIPATKNAPHLLTGERGELEALFFLRRQGYTVVERRWRTPELNGDVDLIAWDGDFLCIIEVKTRSARDLTPRRLRASTTSKRRMLRDMARAYRRTLPRRAAGPPAIRFDVVSVYLSPRSVQCELVQGAFLLHPESRRNEAFGFGV